MGLALAPVLPLGLGIGWVWAAFGVLMAVRVVTLVVRGAEVIANATEGSAEIGEAADHILYVPRTDWILQPIVAIVPLQLLAYYIAREKGLNVDQPRNLAKTVTVE